MCLRKTMMWVYTQIYNDSSRVRTYKNLSLRRRMLYPVELWNLYLMRRGGFEPPWTKVRTSLNRVRLPISPSALWRIPSGEGNQYHHWFLELSYPKNLCFNQRFKLKFRLEISTLNKREDSNLIKSATWLFATRCRTNNPKERSSFVTGTRHTLEHSNQWLKFPKTIWMFDAHLMSVYVCKWKCRTQQFGDSWHEFKPRA